MGRTDRRNLWIGLLFISPWIIGFFAFIVYPILYTFRISFTRYSGFIDPEWIGLENYRDLIKSDQFWTATYNTFYYTLIAVPVGAVVAMILALCMNQALREVPIYRTILYLPSVLPLFALSYVWRNLLDPSQGFFNQILIAVGLPNINWFGDPRYSKIALVILAQFGAGQVAIIFLAGLKGIPSTLYEAAMLDGATSWRRFWGITLPLMTPVILYDIILGVSGGLQAFVQSYIITQGGPANSSTFIVNLLYNNAFSYGNMGYAAAIGVFLFVLTFIIAIAVFQTSNRWVHYGM